MCELHGFTEARTGFARLVHAEATTIAAMRSLLHFARRCSTAGEVADEIRARMTARVQALGLAPDVLDDAIEAATPARGATIRALDKVRDAGGVEGIVTMIVDTSNGPRALVSFDLPGGPVVLTRPVDTLVRVGGVA